VFLLAISLLTCQANPVLEMESDTSSNISTDDIDVCSDPLDVVDTCSWWFIVKAIVLSLILISIIFGNSLVIASVFLYRKLRRSVSNLFIASLALADFMLAILVLPFALAKEIYGYWLFQHNMCKIWLVVDVWVCTASILHLCAISFDRYIAIALPLRYPNLMTNKRCKFICLAMWILSFLICFPALFQNTTGYTNSVKNNSTNSSSWNNSTSTPLPQCDVVNTQPGYIIYSALGSFFIPSFVLIGFYIRIFLLAKRFMTQAQKGVISNGRGQAMRIHRGPSSNKQAISSYELSELMTAAPVAPRQENDNFHTKEDPSQQSTDSQDANQNHLEQPSYPNNSPAHSTLRKGSCKSLSQLLPLPRSQKQSLGNNINRETRAAKTVAIIVGVFILCWTPFFLCYLVQGVSSVLINSSIFNFFVWVGYVNSLFNPCIYAYFSTDYRHAFKKILRCQLSKRRSCKNGVVGLLTSYYVSSSSDRCNSVTAQRHPKMLTT